MYKSNDYKNLSTVVKAFKSAGIDIWLDQGTLLGFIRDRKILPWDNDIDLGMWESELEGKATKLKEQLAENGFVMSISEEVNIYKPKLFNKSRSINIGLYKKKNGHALKYFFKRDENLSFLFYKILKLSTSFFKLLEILVYFNYKSNKLNKLLVGLIEKRKSILNKIYRENGENKKVVIKDIYFKNLKAMKLDKFEYKIPQKTEEYLSIKYGADWKVPKREWNHYENDGAVVQ